MLTAGSLVTGATAVRLSAGCLQLLAQRTPPLMALALRASLDGTDTGASQAAFRDGLVALARDTAERSWHELRRGVDLLDAATRPADAAGAADAAPRRSYRVKP